ncbi:MAG: AraC family transcriptional regulator [Bacteroidota bacterium]
METLPSGDYFGQGDITKTYRGLLLGRYWYTTPNTGWHYHENPYFMFVLAGSMINGTKKGKTFCPVGSLMFNNSQEAHYGAMTSPRGRGFQVEFKKEWLQLLGGDVGLFEGSQLVSHPHVHLLFAKLYHEFMTDDDYSPLTIETSVLQISELLGTVKISTSRHPPPWLSKLKELLHYDTAQLDLTYLSQQLGVHPVHLSRSVHKYLTVSLGEYRRQLKLQRALPLLLNSPQNLTQIAYHCDFADQSHFNRVFKRFFGVAPGQYRKQLRG